jgi:hypothetical protein
MKTLTTLLVGLLVLVCSISTQAQWTNTTSPMLTSGSAQIQRDNPWLIMNNTGTDDQGGIIWRNDGTNVAFSFYQANNKKLQYQLGSAYQEDGSTNAFSIDLDRPNINSTTVDGYVTIGPEGGSRITIDGDDIQRKSGSSTSTLYLNYFGGSVSIAGSTLYANRALNRVGVGTSAPDVNLHIVGNNGEGDPTYTAGTMWAAQQNSAGNWSNVAIIASAVGQASLNFGDKDDDNIGGVRYNNANNYMHFLTNASERMTLSSSGHLGIGTLTPTDELHVVGDARLDDVSPTLSFFNGTDDQGQLKSITTQIEIESGQGDNIRLDAGGTVSGPGSIFMETSNSIRMTIDETGDVTMTGKNIETGSSAGSGIANISIGAGRTSDGQSSFQLVADESIYSDWGVKFARFGNGFSRFTHRGTNAFQFMSADAANIGFLTNSLLRMTIEHTSGDVGIGTSNPASRLHVAGDIFATGSITSSDRRLKRDIDNYSAGLDEVMKLRPVTYFYNGEAGIRSDIKHVGLIAQELETIQPELVGEYLYQNKDMWENVTEEGTYKYIQEGAIKYMLVNAIQEQQEQIEERDERISQLEEINEALLTRVEKLEAFMQGMIEQKITAKHQKDLELNGSEEMPWLKQNEPNPFTEHTIIHYYLPENTVKASMLIYDMNGRVLKTMNIDERGYGQLNLTARSLPAGTYSYQLQTEAGIIANKTMILQ